MNVTADQGPLCGPDAAADLCRRLGIEPMPDHPAPEPPLEWAAEIWRANPAIARAVSLDAFAADPHRHIAAHLTPPPGWDADAAPRPLLPAQRAAAHRLMLSERVYGPRPAVSPSLERAAAERALPADTVRRGGCYVEPLRRHAYVVTYHPERRR